MPRKCTFNAAETNKLFEICNKYKNILECKKTDCISSKQKDDCWEKIAVEFNSVNEIPRNSKEVKTKYKNVKYATKSKSAADRRNVYGTGGGPATAGSTLTAVEERMIDMISSKEFEGMPNTCDADVVLDMILEEQLTEITSENINNVPPPEPETRQPGPATLRSKTSAPLWTGVRRPKETSWEKLAAVKSTWAETKLQAEVAFLQKEKEHSEVQIQLMREKQDLELQNIRERHAKEMELLCVRLQREQMELEKIPK